MTSILALLHSLSEKEPSTTSQPSPFTSSLPNSNSSQEPNKPSLSSSGLGSSSFFRAPLSSHPSLSNISLTHSTSHPSLSASSHPPLPPKPRSRPTSLYAVETDSVTSPGARPSDPAPSEQDLVRELVFVFQGIEGSLIKCEGGNYSLDKNISLPSHQRSVVMKLCEVRWLYGQVHSFTEKQAGEVSYGLVGHSFVTALREELTEYYRLLAALEQNVRDGHVTLLQLGIWTRQPMARLKLLVEIVDMVGMARGGALTT